MLVRFSKKHAIGKIKNGNFITTKYTRIMVEDLVCAYVAQQVAHSLGKAEVMGSSPIISSNYKTLENLTKKLPHVCRSFFAYTYS